MSKIIRYGFWLWIIPVASQCQPGEPVTTIELTKSSRGYQEAIRITPDSAHFSTENRLEPDASEHRTLAVSDRDWETLVDAIGNVPLEEIPNLPSPSMDRAADAAMHSSITITTASGNSYSHGFDDDNPHPALRELLETIRRITGTSDQKR